MNILFIGNSHTFAFGIPFQVRELLNSTSDKNHTVSLITTGGKSLGFHSEQKGTQLTILCNHWDHIFLQQATHPFADKDSHEKDFLAINELLKKTDAKINFCMTWSRNDELDKQNEINNVYTELAHKMNWSTVPISKIWHKLLSKKQDMNLYMPDNSHASHAGAYLVACTCYAHITGKSVRGLTSKIISGSEELIDLSDIERTVIQNEVNNEFSCSVEMNGV